MKRSATPALAGLLLLGLAAAPGAAQAQDGAGDAAAAAAADTALLDEPAFAIQSVIVRDLWQKVRASPHCFGPTVARMDVDNGGIWRDNRYVSAALRNLIDTKLNAAFDAMFIDEPSGRRIDPPEDDKAILRAYVNGDSFADNPVLDRYRDRYLFTSASVRTTPEGKSLMSVTARGLDGCTAQSLEYMLPPELIGDPVEPFEAIFGRAAARILKTVKRGQVVFVYLSAEVDDEGTAPASWTKSLIQEAQLAIQTELDRTTEINSDTTPVVKVRPYEEVGDAEGAESWPSTVKVERRQNTYYVFVNVEPTRGGDIVEKGLVSAEALPPLKMAELAPLNLPSATRSVGARLLSLGEDRRSVEGTFSAAREAHEFGFQLDRPRLVEIGVRPEGDGEAPEVALFGIDGAPIEPNMPTQSPLLRRWRLDGPGIFRVRAENRAAGAAAYTMTSRAADGAFAPALGAGSRITRTFQDWQSGVAYRDGQQRCFATTIATSFAPAGWRPIRPTISFTVDADPPPGEEIDIRQSFDLSRYYDLGSGVSGDVDEAAGPGWRLPLAEFDGAWTARQPDGRMAIAALEAMTLGQSLELRGVTPDGRQATVRYSLRGYQAAINEMLTNCGRLALRQALIRR